jgi:RNA ligase (TIGR02306 family)
MPDKLERRKRKCCIATSSQLWLKLREPKGANMSETFTEIVEISTVRPHPNADRLEIANVKGATVVIQKGAFHPGEKAVWFPPNVVVPPKTAEALGVSKFLKSGGVVSACRLRGQPSYGFLAPLRELPLGSNVDTAFGTAKYEPPPCESAEYENDHPLFHRYTDIQNILRFPDAIPEGTLVRITEKIHGSNCRLGLIHVGEGQTELMAGSNKKRLKYTDGWGSRYWRPLADRKVQSLLRGLSADTSPVQKSVIIFGELFGRGVQDMDYGVPGPTGFRVFDIAVNGAYLDWSYVEHLCDVFGVPTVPLLYSGPFLLDLIEKYTEGPTAVVEPNQVKANFKGREGIVITPLVEQHSDILGGRMILKSVSIDYLSRKAPQDNE